MRDMLVCFMILTILFVPGINTEASTTVNLENMLCNSSFEDGFESWQSSGGKGTYSIANTVLFQGNNSAKFTVDDNYRYIKQDIRFTDGHKIYVSAYSYLESATNPTTSTVTARWGISDYGTYTRNVIRPIFTSKLEFWDRQSILTTANNGGIRVTLGRGISTEATYYFDCILVIDLTEAFGAGSEPTAEGMDHILATHEYLWFEEATILSEDCNQQQSNPWYGTTMNIIGDSITASGAGSTNFSDVAAKELGMKVNNYGINGSMIAVMESKPDIRSPIVTRYSLMEDDADLIIVAAGTNDWQYGLCPVGTMADRTSYTFYGAMHNLCGGLIEKYPGKQILFMTPIKRNQDPLLTQESINGNGKTLKEYCGIIREVCAYYGIPVLDMNSECIINPQIESQSSAYIPDGTHPNKEGHEIMARRLVGYLRQLR